jgi:hypothetical protein
VATKDDKEIFIGPEEGARLPVLDVAHKVPSESLGGGLPSWSGGFLPA